MDERRTHYKHLNQQIFTPLFNLKLQPEEVRAASTIFNDYTYHVYVPRNSLYWDKGKQHLNLDRPRTEEGFSLVERVEKLESDLKSHNLVVDLAEKATFNATKEIVGEIDEQWFFYKTFIILLSEFWRDCLKESVLDSSTLLNRFQTKFPRKDGNEIMRLGDYVVARGPDEQRDLIGKAANVVAVSAEILASLQNIADWAFRLEKQVQAIRFSMSNLKESVELDLYETRAKCCPTPFTLFRRAFFG